jgi:hypothetical protein
MEEWKMASIQSHHSGGKPQARRILRKLHQSMESNAFAKSSLKTRAGALRLAHHWIILAAYTKFSEMERPAMNPD